MKFLLIALLVLVGVVGLALLVQEDSGYVLLSWGEWTVESSLSLLLIVITLTFVALHLLVRLLVNGWRIPGRMAHWRREQRLRKARRSTQRGLLALAECDWKRGERYLIRNGADSEIPLINYLGAARAAQKQGADERRDRYLAQAHQSMPEAELAVGFTQAEVQLSHGQTEHALATLMHLRSIAPKHGYVLNLLRRLYEQLGSWKDLLELLPELRRQKVLEPEAIDTLERKAHAKLLRRPGQSASSLREIWERVPRGQRNGELLRLYVEELLRVGENQDAEKLLVGGIRQIWDPELVRLYGLVQSDDPGRQLSVAESWLADHDRQPDLLLSLGRIAVRADLWGKARAYLEASLGAAPRAETYCELGHLLARLGEGEKSRECFRKGLEQATGSACAASSGGEKLPVPNLAKATG
ncbi:heme biosynthesis HemY N-terminal domain-containing protein [Thiohalomonas denitrificans]|uniref:heme biosynthesis HemY N-terminal domain-containing protein n=1 Tax=Thiohalomonas denitrificans TaxID=415747 RepID=UPI0026EC55E0|nr:heme biosynthesis HemY N-terminal domain-containing protein [Thiohalomonas denitrificans]